MNHIVVDGMNYLSLFSGVHDYKTYDKHLESPWWMVEETIQRVRYFLQCCKNSKVIPHFVFDNGFDSLEVGEIWKSRREDEVNNADHFPTVIEYDPTRLILGTRIRMSPTTASIRLQLNNMYDCMRTAGVEHRDIHCKNTMLKNGRCILIDFDAAKTTRYNDTLTSQFFERHKKSHTARNSNDFYNKLHDCYQHKTEKTKGR
jgi:hypothetical protein